MALPEPLKPSTEENWLTNGETYSKEVHLGKEASPDDWREVTQEEYEAAMESEAFAEVITLEPDADGTLK